MTQWAFSNQPVSADESVTPAASAQLAVAVTSSATTAVLKAGHGALLPVPGGGQIGVVRIEHELLSYTGNLSDTLTGITRGYGGTTPAAHDANRQVRNVIPAEFLNQVQTTLAGKANTSHTHVEADVTSLATDLTARQLTSEKAQPNGYASLNSSGIVPSAQLPPAGAPGAHASTHSSGASDPVTHNNLAGLTTGDPHTQYQTRAEKGVASGYAPLDSGLLVPVANLPAMVGSGASHRAGIVPDPGATSGTTRYLREDATWVAPPSGGGGALLAAYRVFASATVTVSPTPSAMTDVDSLSLSLTLAATSLVKIQFDIRTQRGGSGGRTRFSIFDGSTQIAPVNEAAFGGWYSWPTNEANCFMANATAVVSLAAGAHTLKVRYNAAIDTLGVSFYDRLLIAEVWQ